MADITIKVSAAASPEEEEKEPQAVATLQIRKTLDGNVVIFDHDVAIMSIMLKIVSSIF